MSKVLEQLGDYQYVMLLVITICVLWLVMQKNKEGMHGDANLSTGLLGVNAQVVDHTGAHSRVEGVGRAATTYTPKPVLKFDE